MMATARADGLIPANPAQDLHISSRPADGSEPTNEQERARALSVYDVRRLVAGAPEGQGRILIRTAAASGLRIGELIGLRWADVDTDAGAIRVRSAIRMGTRKAPKSRYGVRTVPIPRDLVGDLRRYRLASEHSQDEHPVFATKAGTPHSPGNLTRRVLQAACDRAGVERIGWHVLRHTFASALLARGATIVQVQRALGHHSPAFTLTAYAHLMPGDEHDPEMVADFGAAPSALDS